MHSLQEQLREYIAAAFPGIWITSFEHDDALGEIAALCKQEQWSLAVWDVDKGLRGGTAAASSAPDPLAALRALPALAKPESSALLVLPNFHRFLSSPEIVQCLANTLQAGKTARTFVVILSPVVQLPVELERQFVVIDHQLPDRDQLQTIAQRTATESGDLPTGEELEKLLDASAGLTRFEAEGAYALSLIRHNKLVPETIWELKVQSLKKSGLLTLHRGGEKFSDLGGLDALKNFCLTLPYPEPGIRLIRQDQVQSFDNTVRELAQQLDEAVGRLDDHYEALKTGAREQLGSLFNPVDYPPTLKGLFGCTWEFPSVEPPDYLRRLNPELFEQERARMTSRFDEAVRLAEEAFVGEFSKLVEHLVERISDTGSDGGKKIFRDTAVEGLKEFFERFKALNVHSSAQLDELVETAQKAVQGVAPQDLRNSEALRGQIAQQMSGVLSSLDDLLVDAPRRKLLRPMPRQAVA